MTFGLLYGSTAGGIAMNLGITSSEAQTLIDLYFNAYPLIKRYIENTHNMALANHMGISHFGRRKMEYGTLPCFKWTAAWNAALRNLQNFRIQSPTSDLGLYCFSYINTEIKRFGGKSLACIYDSLETEIPIPHLAEAVEIFYVGMEDLPVETFPWLTLPIGMEAEVGPNWGTLTEIHRGITQEEIEAILRG